MQKNKEKLKLGGKGEGVLGVKIGKQPRNGLDELESFSNLMASSMDYGLGGGNVMMDSASMGKIPYPNK